jgi:uncharacterized protein
VNPEDGAPRLRFIDTLRGVAIGGIVLVNIPDMIQIDAQGGVARMVLDLAVQTRFVPIFELLFGAGIWFVVRSARERGRSPWAVMLARLAALWAIGMLHSLVYPGEVLATYAVAGLLVLPLVLLAPRWLQLALGAGMELTVLTLAGSSPAEAPGLMLLGAAAAGYGVPTLLERSARPVTMAFLAATALCVPALAQQLAEPGDPRFSVAGGRAGFVMAVAYVSGLSLLWATPVRRVLAAICEPIGRMALTCYVTTSLIAVPVGALAGFAGSSSPAPALVLGFALIAVQTLACRVWLRNFRYGPLEWAWRAVTWRCLPTMRRPHCGDERLADGIAASDIRACRDSCGRSGLPSKRSTGRFRASNDHPRP